MMEDDQHCSEPKLMGPDSNLPLHLGPGPNHLIFLDNEAIEMYEPIVSFMIHPTPKYGLELFSLFHFGHYIFLGGYCPLGGD